MKSITKSVKKQIGMEMTLQEVIQCLLDDEMTIIAPDGKRAWGFKDSDDIVVKYDNEVIDPAKIKILVTEGEE